MSKFDNEQSLLSNIDEIDLKRILDWTTIHPDLMHKLFASPMPSLNDVPTDTDHDHQHAVEMTTNHELTTNDNNDALKFRQFPTHNEYAQGISGLCDSVSIVAGTKSDSGDSLPDMELEAKKRNLIIGKMNLNNDANWPELLSPPKPLPLPNTEQQKSKSLSSSDTFEEELNKMKMNWAGSIIRKTKKLHAMTSSSSSSIENPVDTRQSTSVPKNSFIDSNITNNSVSLSSTTTTTAESPDSNKKPMNLKEFFAKELLRRTQSLSSSSTSSPLLNDSTLSSNFLRSLLATSNQSSQSDGQNQNAGTTTALTDKHITTQRTSTPVRLISTDSTSLSNSGVAGGISAPINSNTRDDGNLFSAESRLSSVKNNSTSTNSSTNTNDGQKPLSSSKTT